LIVPAAVRRHFPGTRRGVYLNAAAAGLLPQDAVDAMARTAARLAEAGVRGFPEDMRGIEGARSLLAGLLDASPDDVAFVGSTAEAVSRVAEGLDLRPGDEVVLGEVEFPANVLPWAAQRARGVRLRWVAAEDGRVPAGRLAEAIGPRTRVVAVSSVQFASGYRVDLDALGEACRARGVLLAVDAIQSLGVVPLRPAACGAGVVTGDGRKWLLGPPGTGFLYVAPEWCERIRPVATGTRSLRRDDDMLAYLRWRDAAGDVDFSGALRERAGRFESGYPSVVPLHGLAASLAFTASLGRESVAARVLGLASRLARGLEAAGFRVTGPRADDERAGIVAFATPSGTAAEAEAWWRELDAAGFSVSARAGRLRASPHVYNTEDEIDSLVAHLSARARRG
jgi:cysteine desulfurase/selenocysteine lyase